MASIDNSAWDGPAAMSAASKSADPAASLNAICAGKKAGDPKTEAAHALPYRKTPTSPPNAGGVRDALSRLSQCEGLTNSAEAKSLLEGHMKEIQAAATKAASPLDIRAMRSAAYKEGIVPGGPSRSNAYNGEIRGQVVMRNGKQYYQVEGYATTFNQPYQMYDFCGEYNEKMGSSSLDLSLSRGPDVSFLENHRGLTMARTVSLRGDPTLELAKDTSGLHCRAFLNSDRQDVRDLMSAISDGIVTEMSFAFMLNDGVWDKDFANFEITEADINRGDVSAVNYGANPYTSIEARAAQMFRDLDRAPAGIVSEAFSRIQARLADLGDLDLSDWEAEDLARAREEAEHVEAPAEEKRGKSLKIWQMRLSGTN